MDVRAGESPPTGDAHCMRISSSFCCCSGAHVVSGSEAHGEAIVEYSLLCA